jgi:hypothetical protein
MVMRTIGMHVIYEIFKTFLVKVDVGISALCWLLYNHSYSFGYDESAFVVTHLNTVDLQNYLQLALRKG